MNPTTRRRARWILPVLGIAALGAALAAINGCAASFPNRNPVGETFPSVTGQSLEKEEVRLPDDFAGRPAIILVGYKQRSQFDIDRWLMGILQSGADAQIVELPTIPGLVPSLASGWIDDGMRSGIPREEWGAVVTLYGSSARPVAEFTGNEEGQLARILLLDSSGAVVWFDDKGYSPRKALELAERAAALD
ncbi:MAG: hypothetical protein VYC34_12570 [Planctomycetota bacterium]|nr:hypothetical protein [Planctomycetota bacterium]